MATSMGTERAPRYLQIAQHYERQIRSGQLSEGTRLPSVRELAVLEGVSVNTARSALGLLQEWQLVHSQARVGMRVAASAPATHSEPFAPFALDASLAQVSRQWLAQAILPDRANLPFLNMSPGVDNPQNKSFLRCYRQALHSPPVRNMERSAGHLALRQLLVEQFAERALAIHPDELQITDGCQHALEHALRVVARAGQTLAIPTPCFPGYLALAGSLGLKVMEIPMSPQGPVMSLLQQVMQSGEVQALLLNPICHNPTGSSLCDADKRQIAEWAEQYQCVVIEDDIAASLHFSQRHPRPIASFCKQGWVMLVGSMSKLIGDSERIGWCYPGRFRDAYMTQFVVSQFAGAHFKQKALARYWAGSRFAPQLREWRRRLCEGQRVAQAMFLERLGDAVSVVPVSGGYSLWAQLPETVSVAKLQERAQAQGLGFLSGQYFSLDCHFKRYIRLVIMPPFAARARADLARLVSVIEDTVSAA